MKISSLSNGIKADLNYLKNENLPWHLRVLEGCNYVKREKSGNFVFCFLGTIVIQNLFSLIKHNLSSIEAREYLFPFTHSVKYWEKKKFSENFKKTTAFIDDMVVAPTQEEIAYSMIAKDLTYRNLPHIVFSFGHYLRKEIRPKNGLFRSREFLLLEGFAFNKNEDQYEVVYGKIKEAIVSMLRKLGLNFKTVLFRTNFDKKFSEEFVVNLNHIGEKRIAECPRCGQSYRAVQFEKCICGGDLAVCRGIEIGDIVRNGIVLSLESKTGYVDKFNKKNPYFFISFGIGMSKLIAAIIEQSIQDKRFVWPKSISPFDLAVVLADSLKKIENPLFDQGIKNKNILIDDRDLSIGRRVKELEMLGMPIIVIVKSDDTYELIDRTNNQVVGTRMSFENLKKALEIIL